MSVKNLTIIILSQAGIYACIHIEGVSLPLTFLHVLERYKAGQGHNNEGVIV